MEIMMKHCWGQILLSHPVLTSVQ